MQIIYTPDEQKLIKALDAKYRKLMKEAEDRIEAVARYYNRPDDFSAMSSIDPHKEPERYRETLDKIHEAITEWDRTAPPEWQQAIDAEVELLHEQSMERSKLFDQCERRQFNELGGDLGRIMDDAKKQASWVIEAIYKYHEDENRRAFSWSAIDVVSLGDGKWLLDAEQTRATVTRNLHLHFDAFLGRADLIDELTSFIKQAVAADPHVAPEGTPGRGGKIETGRRRRSGPRIIDFDLHLHDESRQQGDDLDDRQIGIDEMILAKPVMDAEPPEVDPFMVDPRQHPRYLSVPSFKGYDSALMGDPRGMAYITALEDETFLAGKEFKDGFLMEAGRDDLIFTLKDIKTKKQLTEKDVDIPLLLGIYTAVHRGREKMQNGVITIKRSVLADYLGLQIHGGNAFPIINKLRQFENIIGVRDNGRIDRLLVFLSYDATTDIIKLYCGYMLDMIEDMKQQAIIAKKAGPVPLPDHNFLWHSSSVSEKNDNALLLGIELTNVIMKAGKHNAAHISYRELIARIPTLKAALDNQKATKDKNIVLKRAFIKAFELIRTRSDAYKYWVNLTISPAVAPTSSGLNNVIRIKHDGVNKDYQITQ